jgi:hypothetical protein
MAQHPSHDAHDTHDEDYGYGLSHERGGSDAGPRTWRVAPRVQHRTSVPAPRADTEGDYGYDCAHEVPRSEARR